MTLTTISKIIALLFLCIISSFSQLHSQTIKGLVQDEKGKPISFCSVGLYGKGLGTVTNEHGIFEFSEKQVAGVTKLKISHVAFEDQDVSIVDMQSHTGWFIITMKEKLNDTGTYFITGDSYNDKMVLGSRRAKKGALRASDMAINRGEIMGNSFIISKPSLLDEFRFKVKLNQCEKAKFRIHIIEMKDDEVTSNELLREDLFVNIDSTGWYSADLEQFNLVVTYNVLMGLEFLGVKGCPLEFLEEKTPYAALMEGYETPYKIFLANYQNMYVRPNNTREWLRMTSFGGLAFQLIIYQ